MTQHKSFALADFKAAADPSGGFTALVSVFGNVDLGGDRMMPGAFTKSLDRWRASGDPIPVIWNHDWDNPLAHIGKIDPNQAEETVDGLLVKGTLDTDTPFAQQVHRLLTERRVKELSFGYQVIDSKAAKGGVNELLEVDLFEVGPTLKGMNPETELLAVKAMEDAKDIARHVSAKAGARHSRETLAMLQQMRDMLDQLIAAGSPADETPKSIEAEASGKASDVDEDIRTRIQLLKEQST